MHTPTTIRLLLATAAVLAIGVMFAPAAFAAKVANPGNVTFTFGTGSMDIGDNHFDAASEDDPITANATVTANGAITVTSMYFPPLEPIDGPLGPVNITINVIGTPTGTINPLTGAATLNFTVRIDADGNGVGNNCHVGPVSLAATTGTTAPPGPNTPITGVPYNPADGSATFVENSFGVPSASGCSTFPVNVNNEINSELGLPSHPGNNSATFAAVANPIIQRALVADFTASPSNGPAPLSTTLDASSTFHTRPITSYEWDFDGDGDYDQTTLTPSVSQLYVFPGTYNVKLRVTDLDGDQSVVVHQITTIAQPDLGITKSHSGNFITGEPGTYTIGLSNSGSQDAGDTVTVVDELPAGLVYAGSGGSGWSCSPSGQTVTCTSDDDIAIGGSSVPLTIDVVPDSGTANFVTNMATVTVNGDTNSTNNTAQDVTQVIQAGIDVTATKTLDEPEGLLRGRDAHYRIKVSNIGTVEATERVRIVDPIPAGLSFVSAAGGLDWVCNFVSGAVRCFSDDNLAPGASLQDIVITTTVDSDAPDSITNSVTTSVSGETNPSNDTVSHTGTVLGYSTDYSLDKSHTGTFLTGEVGSYRLKVKNEGTQIGGNDVTVTDQLPIGMTYEGYLGTGWSCSALGQSVTCVHAGQVEPGDELPTLTIQVTPQRSAAGTVVNEAGLFSDDDFNPANDADSDSTEVRLPQPDLSITKTHSGNFTSGTTGAYFITVRNVGIERADGPTTVVDTLPAGMEYQSATGSGWVCNNAGQAVTCSYAGVIAGGAVAPVITLNAKPTIPGGTILTNVVDVSNADDTVESNNHATDPTAINVKLAEPTVLTASAVVLNLLNNPNTTGISARLTTPAGVPIPGKVLHFKTDQTQTVLCNGTTNANGEGRCAINTNTLIALALAQGRYRAYWNGDADTKASESYGTLIYIAKIKLL